MCSQQLLCIRIYLTLQSHNTLCHSSKYSQFSRITNIKNVVLIKPHHIAQGKMARTNVKDEFDYHGKGELSIISINWHFR